MNTYRFIYLRNGYQPSSKASPIGCVAMCVEDFDSLEANISNAPKTLKIKYQVSVANPQDHFDRSLARQIAIGRIVEAPFSLSLTQPNPTTHDITYAVMSHIEKNQRVSSRARRSATAWLNRVSVAWSNTTLKFSNYNSHLVDPFDMREYVAVKTA